MFGVWQNYFISQNVVVYVLCNYVNIIYEYDKVLEEFNYNKW